MVYGSMPTNLAPPLRAVVIGAGMVGLCIGYHLARGGARLTVLDAAGLATRTSRVSFAWINANGKSPEDYFELNRAGLAEHAAFARTLGSADWLHGGGSLEWADTDAGRDQLERRSRAMADAGYGVQRLTAAQVTELEPDLAPFRGGDDGADAWAIHFSDEGWADSSRLAQRLAGAIQDAGGGVALNTAVTSLQEEPGGLAVLSDGQRWEADVVVNAAGPEAGRIAAFLGIRLVTQGPFGMTCVTGPVSARIGRVIRAPGVHFRPEGAGLMLSSPAADAEVAAGRDPSAVAAELLVLAARHVPALAGAEIHEVRTGPRAVPQDGLPAIGRLTSAPRLYHAVMHSGITLAPLVGRLVAEELLSGTPNPTLEPYRPSRLTA